MKNINFKNYNKSQLALPVELEIFYFTASTPSSILYFSLSSALSNSFPILSVTFSSVETLSPGTDVDSIILGLLLVLLLLFHLNMLI